LIIAESLKQQEAVPKRKRLPKNCFSPRNPVFEEGRDEPEAGRTTDFF
jgi:hypothetical protein